MKWKDCHQFKNLSLRCCYNFMQTLSNFIEMGVHHAWIVLSPSISSDVDDEQSDSVSVISESDRDDNADSPSNSKYFWDNTHISLSNENSTEEQIVPESKLEDVFEELVDNKADKFQNSVEKPDQTDWKKTFEPCFWLALILITNLCIYSYSKSEHSISIRRIQLAEAQNKDLQFEINTLRKIIFRMNADEQLPQNSKASFKKSEDMTSSKDVRIYVDGNSKKFICIDVKKFVDLL